MNWIDFFGYGASLCMILGYMPQAWHTIRTRDTDGIALPTFLLTGIGSIFFVINGILLDHIPLIITNALTTVSSLIVFGIKIQNDYFPHKTKQNPDNGRADKESRGSREQNTNR